MGEPQIFQCELGVCVAQPELAMAAYAAGGAAALPALCSWVATIAG